MSTSFERAARAVDRPVRHFHGGGRYLQMRHKGTADFNLAVACRNVLNLLVMSDIDDDALIIMDRGPVDSLVFSEALFAVDRIATGDLEVIQRLVWQSNVLSRLDAVVLLVADEPVLIERERRSYETVHKSPLLGAIDRATRAVHEKLQDGGYRSVLLDTSSGTESAIDSAVALLIEDLTSVHLPS